MATQIKTLTSVVTMSPVLMVKPRETGNTVSTNTTPCRMAIKCPLVPPPSQVISIMASLTQTFYFYFFGLADRPLHLWISTIPLYIFGNLISTVSRASISKIVPNDEQGKMFSLIAIGQAVLPMGVTPTASAIFDATVATDPGVVYYVTAFILLGAFGGSVRLDLLKRKEEQKLRSTDSDAV